MIHFSSSADPRTGQVHYVAQSFQPTLHLNSISPPSLPIPLLSLSPQHRSCLSLLGCCQPPKSPGVDSHRAQSSTGSAMGIMLPTRGPRSMPQGCSLPTGVQQTPRGGQWGDTYSQARSTGQSFLTSFARLTLEERGQGHEVEGFGGSRGMAGWGDWGVGPLPDGQQRLKSRISTSYAQRCELIALPRGSVSWLRCSEGSKEPWDSPDHRHSLGGAWRSEPPRAPWISLITALGLTVWDPALSPGAGG